MSTKRTFPRTKLPSPVELERRERRTALLRFTDDELLEELARRRNAQELAAPKRWCSDCAHFKTWDVLGNAGDPPDDFNPCTKGHVLMFRMPDSPADVDFGFYRRVCGDRSDTGAADPQLSLEDA